MFKIVPMQFVDASPMAPRIAVRIAIVTDNTVFQFMFLFCSIAAAKLLTFSDMAKKSFQSTTDITMDATWPDLPMRPHEARIAG